MLLRSDAESEPKRTPPSTLPYGAQRLRSPQARGSRYGVIRIAPVPTGAVTSALGKRVKRPPRTSLSTLRVTSRPGFKSQGYLVAGSKSWRCALGPAGIAYCKREGDGATPAGSFRLLRVLIRADRIGRPATQLPVQRLGAADGWCDDAGAPVYNRSVRRPSRWSHEALWRDDGLYDCIVVIDYNIAPAQRARGSAIFLHVASPALTATAGCVAVPRAVLLRLLPRLGPRTRIIIRR